MDKRQLARAIITVRYPQLSHAGLAEYFTRYGQDSSAVVFLLDELVGLLEDPITWPGYELPAEVVANSELSNRLARRLVADFRLQAPHSPEAVERFLFGHHQIFKYGIRRWLLPNAGVALEQFTIAQDHVEQKFLLALQERGVKLGDDAIHMHVVSNREREDLRQRGFSVPYAHWDEAYYRGALMLVGKLLASNEKIIGFFCEDSWVFDPAIHELASDGRPIASFSFLKSNLLVGERFFVGRALSNNAYSKQYEFALRSPRRRSLYEQGEFTPKTYGAYYSRKALFQNMDKIAAKGNDGAS